MFDPTVQQPGQPVKQFSLMLNNRTGALASILQLLESRGIYCIGISVQDCQEVAITRLILTDPEQAITLFLERGIGFTWSEMTVISLPSGSQGLNACVDALCRTDINIDFLYPLIPCCRGYSRIALHLSDPSLAHSVLNKAGIIVLYQEDLSR